MSFEWNLVRLHEVANTRNGAGIKQIYFANEGVLLVRVTNFTDDSIDLSECIKVDVEHSKKWPNHILKFKDVIVATVGSWPPNWASVVGKTILVPKNAEGSIQNQNTCCVTAKPEKLDQLFLYYILRSDSFIQFAANSASGSANQARLPVAKLESFEFAIPPLTEQKEIASILSALDNRISLLRETNTTLEAIAQTLFKSWFVDFDPVKAKAEGRLPEGMDEATAALFPSEFEESVLGFIPKGWKVEKLGDIVQRITKGTTPTTFKKPFVSSGINFIKAESMTEDGDFIPDKFAFIDSDTHELLRRSQLQSGDVLITIAGTIGRMAIITEEFLPANTNQAVAIIRPISEHLPSGLLSLFLQTSALREVMDGKIVQAVQANLSLTSLSDLQLVIPPKQTVFMLYQVGIAHINDVKKHNRSMIRTLTTLRDTLLPRLISGQLRLNQAQEIMDEVGA